MSFRKEQENRMRPSMFLKCLLFTSALALANSASAGTFAARISNILLYEDGDLVYIYVEGGTQQRPACAGSNGDYLSFKMSRPRAKEYLAALLTAFTAGKRVDFYTAGECIDQSVSDTLRYFAINAQ